MRNGRRFGIVVGFDYYGQFLASLINERSDSWHLSYYSAGRIDTVRALLDGRHADVIITFGGPAPNVALVELARRRRIPVVVIWAGTDVITARNDPHLLEVIKRYGFTNVSDGPWLVDELAELGIEAQYVPVTAVQPDPDLKPLPSSFSVLTYLPEPRRSFYGEKIIYALAREFPDIPFRVVGRGGRNPVAPRNVEFLGYVDDMPKRLDDTTVVVRLPEHDGKSMLVVETLARGRHVIWNYDFPGVHHARNGTDAAALLRGLIDAHADGRLGLNVQGARFARETFSRERLAHGFLDILETAQTQRSSVTEVRRRRIAISGLDLFSAQIAEQLERYVPGWDAQILRSRSRLEVVTSMFTLASAGVWYSIGAPIGDRWLHLLGRLLRKPRVIHWVGSDIAALNNNPGLRAFCRQPHVHNLAEADWTIDELKRLGIDAALAPLPPRLKPVQTLPLLPEKLTVLLYLPKTRGDFYGRREYERLIRAFATRDVRFLVVGGGELYAPPGADVEHLGWRTSLADVYERVSVLIRFTKHDGLSLMILEALTYGRHVLWTQDFPFVTAVHNYAEIVGELESLLERHERGDLELQRDAALYVQETYAASRCTQRIVDVWQQARGTSPRRALAMERA